MREMEENGQKQSLSSIKNDWDDKMVGVGKESESLLACYQSITFLVSRVRSLLGEPLYFTV